MFLGNAGNLVTNESGGMVLNVFLRDRVLGLTRLVSAGVTGAGGDGNSSAPSLTPDGRFIVFESVASNLVTGDTNGAADVFVRDMLEESVRLVSANYAGSGAGGAASGDAAITPDARYVAFCSAADNLVADDSNGLGDVFVRDRQTGVTTLISCGAQGGGGRSEAPAISADGRFVAFLSTATNLVAGVTNREPGVYLHDRVTGTTHWVSRDVPAVVLSALGSPIAGAPTCFPPALSADGRWMAFKVTAASGSGSRRGCLILRFDSQSEALELVTSAADLGFSGFLDEPSLAMTANGRFIAYGTELSTLAPRSVFRWDGDTGLTLPVSLNLAGVLSTSGDSCGPALTPDGRHVAFLSAATNLVTNVVAGGWQVYVRDLVAGTTRLVTADERGDGVDYAVMVPPTISADGCLVAFDGVADSFVAGDENRSWDVFVRDLLLERTQLISQEQTDTAFVTANGWSSAAGNCVSADGRFVVFTSFASDLVAGDTNGCRDVFVRDLLTGSNRLVSLAVDGSLGNQVSFKPTISADGRCVVFASHATNLVANDTNGGVDLFLRDLENQQTHLITVDLNGNSAKGVYDDYSMSADGSRIAFRATSTNLPGTIPNRSGIYVRDVASGTTARASGAPGSFQISPDGARVLVYESTSRLSLIDLGSGATTPLPYGVSVFSRNGRYVFMSTQQFNQPTNMLVVLDATTGATNAFPLSTLPGALLPNCTSDDGRFVVLLTPVVRRTDPPRVHLYDCQCRTLSLIDVNRLGTEPANGIPRSPSLSVDGRFVAYQSTAGNIVAGDGNERADVFLYDRVTGRTTLVSASNMGLGSANYASGSPALSASGNRVVFCSGASDLAPGDFNQMVDVFAYTVTPDQPVDSDHDGLEDNWERSCFGDLSRDGSADCDGDGFTDRQEYVTGTDPMDRRSTFGCEAVRLADGQIQVSWPAAPARAYRVQFKDQLSSPAWNDLVALVTIVGSHATVLDATAPSAPQRFYRVTLVEWPH